jgi:hypothetical protein
MLSLKLKEKEKYLLEADRVMVTENWVASEVREFLKVAEKEAQGNEKALKTIRSMQDNLESKWNEVAGYTDIGHKGLNKYSTLNNELKKIYGENVKTCIIHIGDSSTDKMPTEEMGPGEVNEGADKVFLAGVNNSNESFRKAVEARGPRGIMVARPSILGFDAIIHGVSNAIDAVGEAKAIDKHGKDNDSERLLFGGRL